MIVQCVSEKDMEYKIREEFKLNEEKYDEYGLEGTLEVYDDLHYRIFDDWVQSIVGKKEIAIVRMEIAR